MQGFLETVGPGYAELYGQSLYNSGYTTVQKLASALWQDLQDTACVNPGDAKLIIASAATGMCAVVIPCSVMRHIHACVLGPNVGAMSICITCQRIDLVLTVCRAKEISWNFSAIVQLRGQNPHL